MTPVKRIRILFTSVGRRVELLQAFSDAAARLGEEVLLFGGDVSDDAPALRFCDRRIRTPRISDPDYVPFLLELCRAESISALIPTIDTDLLLLAERKAEFEAAGTRVLTPSAEKVALCRDKRKTAAYFRSLGLSAPETRDAADWTGPFPAFAKPLDGSSSVGAHRVDSPEELAFRARTPGTIVQSFAPGREYTIDAFCGFDGSPVFVTPRERLAVRSGEVLKTRIENDGRMVDECLRLLADLRPSGAVTVQLIRGEDGEDRFIEINPRFGGGAPLSMKAGADSAEACIRLLRGETLPFRPGAAEEGAVYSRFDQSVRISEGSPVEKISSLRAVRDRLDGLKAVVFDLDDTLYAERDYARSGLKAVARLLPSVPDAETALWEAFLAGKKPIDEVLRNAGLTDPGLHAECLKAYRFHRPEISLRPDALPLLAELRKRGVRTAILTDGRPEGQNLKLDVLGLRDQVDEILITDELGGPAFRKPCDIGFRILQKRLGIPFSETAYVGDNPAKDFTAPRALGMRSLWLADSE